MRKYPIRCMFQPDLITADGPDGQRWLCCRFPYSPEAQRSVMHDLHICEHHWELIPGSIMIVPAAGHVHGLAFDIRIPVRSEIQATDFEWNT